MVEIREVKTRKQLKDFVQYPNKLYKGNPNYVPTLDFDEMSNLTPKTNPAFEYCDIRNFLAYRDGKIVGRVSAVLNKARNALEEKPRLRFTRIDFIDDMQVSAALMATVEQWAKELGISIVHGPIGFCDLDKEGMLVEGFDEIGLFITFYNHPYYPRHLEALGYAKDVDWIEMEVKTPEKEMEMLKKIAEKTVERYELNIVKLKKMKDIHPYVPAVFNLLNECYEHLYGVVPITDKQRDMYVKQFFGLLNPDYVIVVQDADKEVIGFALAAPSLTRPAQKANGKLLPLGWYHILRGIKHHDRLDLYLVAVKPEYQSKGVNGVMIYEVLKNAKKNGVKSAETGPELETNEKVQTQWKIFETRQHKRRRCFIKHLEG